MRNLAKLGGAMLLLVCAAGAEERWRTPADWSWLQYGKTTTAEVIAKAGEPAFRSKQKLARGVLDFRLHGAGVTEEVPPGPDGTRPPAIDVEVLGYGDGAPLDGQDRLVFHQDRLLYSVVLPPEPEQSVLGQQERFGEGRPFVTYLPRGTSFDAWEVYAYDSERIAYARRKKKNPGDFPKRIRWAPKSAAIPGLEEVEWKLPEYPRPFAGEK